ncbi:hypothetical protein K9U39_03065 [Rhodoblastus acidophilus]|uniref:Uncharacterized protein n=1 Tax=Candidatus Rhodoblastus alkanivorans TaxID=2954117 RepID=A0ABS9Z4M3_9HYPH|nr:hypothetical protein [Candidatus Rhodoblastus alkanivorans]MCI4677638.1 hypothetical protein [Candidatus Rhodoblastus alkanivorans]MCI4682630.1 hypothetical protein [Candidatus Rhodoblastus alkanivorans]MDI4639936.1 hypothetical protein [Rhodoblastus acidophilus]
MARRTVLALASAGMILTGWGAAAAQWRLYHNSRFGATADYPADWKVEPAPENNDGRAFTSSDGRARLTISGIFALEGREEEFAEKARPLEGETVTYTARKGDWIVVSGLRGGKIFYRKAILSCGNKVWNDLDIEYPKAEKAKYDAVVAHLADSLRPGSGYDTDCK